MTGGKARWLMVPLVTSITLLIGLLLYWLLGKTISGTVTDLTGQPISNAVVQAGWRKVTTDAQGKFTIHTLPGQAAITASYNNESTVIDITDNTTTTAANESNVNMADLLGSAAGATDITPAELQSAQQEQTAGYYPKPPTTTTITIPTTVEPIQLPPPVDPDSFVVNEEGEEVVPGEIIVGWQDNTTAAQRAQLITQAGGTMRYDDIASNTTIVYVADQVKVPGVVKQLKQSDLVTGALPNYRWEPETAPNDPDYQDKNKRWWLQRVNAEPMWAITKGSHSVIVAVIDAGFQTNHPDLQGVFTGASLNYTNKALTDDAKHGTHVSGIIAAQQNNNLGLTGLAPNVRIFPIKINDIARLADIYPILTRLPNVRIATMSMGWVWSKRNTARVKKGKPPFTLDYMKQKSEELDKILRPGFMSYYEVGGVMTKSAGNDSGLDARLNGLNFPEVITVGASMPKGGLTNFSNVGPKVDIVAPGYYIWSTIHNSTYYYLSGTSMATPIVAGTVAAIRSVKPNYGPLVIKLILRKSSTQPGDLASTTYAHLDAWRALLRATKLFGVTGSVDTADYEPAKQAVVSTKPSFWTGLTDNKSEFVIPFLKRQNWTLQAKKGDAKGEEEITDPPLADDEVLEFVNITLEGDNTNENENENKNENENVNDSDTNANASTGSGENDNSSSTESVDDETAGGYTLPNGVVVSAQGCAEAGFTVPPAEGDCAPGFYFSRETIACEQKECPDGVGRTYTLECKCEGPNKAIYACNPSGYMVACIKGQ